MRDAEIYLTETMLVLENTAAIERFQFRIVVPFNTIEKTEKRGGLLTITKENGETIKISFLRKKKLLVFYERLSHIDHNHEPDATKCAFCGATLQGKYCTVCGQQRIEITQEEATTTQPHRCWSCGAEFETKVGFCAECGAKQDVSKLLVRICAEMSKKYLYNVCPKCGGRNIKLYRKGYDYKVGFWGSIFGVSGSGYAGGFDSNKTCCRCTDCGKDWETDYDYRLINK
jgi:DNA-directed RNA polymerase subunit RPC12/RpoP